MNFAASNWTACYDIAAKHAMSLAAAGIPPFNVSSHSQEGQQSIYDLPNDVVVDAGAAISMLGLRRATHDIRDVDLVWTSTWSTAGERLVRFCQRPARRTQAARCKLQYESHGPPSQWWRFYNLTSADALVNDPARPFFALA